MLSLEISRLAAVEYFKGWVRLDPKRWGTQGFRALRSGSLERAAHQGFGFVGLEFESLRVPFEGSSGAHLNFSARSVSESASILPNLHMMGCRVRV